MQKLIIFFLLFSYLAQAMDQQIALKGKIREIARKDDPQQLEEFLKTNSNDSDFTLSKLSEFAIGQNAPRCMRFLLSKGASLTRPAVDGFAEPLLYKTLCQGHYTVAEVLFQHGASPDDIISKKFEAPLLEYFSSCGNWEQTKWLIEHGASPQIIKYTYIDSPQKRRQIYCSLLRSICQGTGNYAELPVEILHLFFTNGVDLNSSDAIEGNTCLHALIARNGSSSKNKLALIIYLISAGAQVNCTNNQGDTPLHIAVSCKEKNIVAYLLLNGANKNALNKNKNTALGIANLLSYNNTSRNSYQDLKNILESDMLPEMPDEVIKAEKELQKLKQRIA